MLENRNLNLYPIDYPFETLILRTNTNPAKLILDPEFQRKYKWDNDGNERASKFIESCLMRIPLPACYFAENELGNHIVIDGVQRITSIKRFFNDEFKLEGLTIFNELEGKLFSELGDYKTELENTTIRCIILRKENPKELIQEIFARLNQGAVQLTAQEIRHAIYPGKLDNLLIKLSENPFIISFGNGISGKNVKDGRETNEMILRYFAMQNDLSNYEDKLSKYLDKFIEKNQNIDDDQIVIMRTDFIETLNKCMLTFDNNPFVNTTKTKERQSLVYYDLLMWSFHSLTTEYITANKQIIGEKFKELCQDVDFNKTLSGGLQQKSSILRRRKLWLEKLDSING
ncbi:DUF262 domain-containing protein [Flavobacterium soyangense]|uniref:DUF262 domain-containing protein n=1 Tax=Flavobacterium soyangense TaxID=2023265 RepID=A0A930XZ79_9FLAO|nr:DUF262 domain-containing protein [Flavobacterium soyangense]MBF2708603.1 DUF262 domain-containing protein [Flavobacterium soyangense]